MIRVLFLACTLSLAACGSGQPADTDAAPNEATALNDAAEMLDVSPDSMAISENMTLETESGTGNGL